MPGMTLCIDKSKEQCHNEAGTDFMHFPLTELGGGFTQTAKPCFKMDGTEVIYMACIPVKRIAARIDARCSSTDSFSLHESECSDTWLHDCRKNSVLAIDLCSNS